MPVHCGGGRRANWASNNAGSTETIFTPGDSSAHANARAQESLVRARPCTADSRCVDNLEGLYVARDHLSASHRMAATLVRIVTTNSAYLCPSPRNNPR